MMHMGFPSLTSPFPPVAFIFSPLYCWFVPFWRAASVSAVKTTKPPTLRKNLKESRGLVFISVGNFCKC